VWKYRAPAIDPTALKEGSAGASGVLVAAISVLREFVVRVGSVLAAILPNAIDRPARQSADVVNARRLNKPDCENECVRTVMSICVCLIRFSPGNRLHVAKI
jgi:hypothetical protein